MMDLKELYEVRREHLLQHVKEVCKRIKHGKIDLKHSKKGIKHSRPNSNQDVTSEGAESS
jgi:hypothetical protein